VAFDTGVGCLVADWLILILDLVGHFSKCSASGSGCDSVPLDLTTLALLFLGTLLLFVLALPLLFLFLLSNGFVVVCIAMLVEDNFNQHLNNSPLILLNSSF
jgi:hypothetical protein